MLASQDSTSCVLWHASCATAERGQGGLAWLGLHHARPFFCPRLLLVHCHSMHVVFALVRALVHVKWHWMQVVHWFMWTGTGCALLHDDWHHWQHCHSIRRSALPVLLRASGCDHSLPPLLLCRAPQRTQGGGRSRAGKALCKLYHSRPMQCRTWPFWQEVVQSQESWNEAASECPGMNAGTMHSGDDILASSSLPYPL